MTRHRRATPLRLVADPDSPLCSSGKRGFRTEAEVRFRLCAARRLRTADPLGGRRPLHKECGYYRCPGCGWWHLTSRSTR